MDRMQSSLIIIITIVLLYTSSFLVCVAKECTNTPSPLASHTLRYELLQSKNETLKKQMFSHYHLTPTDDAAWSSLLPRKMLREEEDEFGWTLLYRQFKNSNSSANSLKEVSLHDVRLDLNSFHWRAQQTNLEYLLMLDVDGLAWNFRKEAGLDAPGNYYGGWERPDSELRGHFVGHYLSATAYMWASTHNNTLKEKMSALVSALSECQEKTGTGYLSAFPSSFFDRFEAVTPVWAPYYTIHKILAGLVDQYKLAGNSQALKMATGMADYFYDRVRNVIRKYTVERHFQSLNEETGGMNDVLYQLYSITGNSKYLLLAHLFDKPCFLGVLAIQADDISGFHSNTHIPIVIGSQQRYEITGDPIHKEISMFFMDIVNASHSYATGGTSVNEFWQDPKRMASTLQTENEESCTTYNMLKVNSISQADACKVTPAKFSGSKEVVPLHFRRSQVTGSASSGDTEEIFFDFRKQRFIFSKELGVFSKLPYPTKETFGHYLKCTGHGTEAKLATATEKWGRNVFDYPQPTFQKLMKENCMEPFFVFQVFCVGLWCLDEFWYYSVFTLFMLFMFESTMAKSRLKTLTDLRRVRVDSQTVMVYRCGRWASLLGTELLPGDIVSIGRPSTHTGGEDKTVPADMLLLVGSAIVNEAILTGESTPQWKVPIAGIGSDEKLSIKRDKNHVLFGGTKILQHSPDRSFSLKTPDGGCLAVVLRTGFETSQGKLMRTILFSTERVTANSWESGLFILFLVVFAVIAAGYVLVKGLEDPTRSKYKLLLGCSIIITSVIPPELPMELSIAVNTSLIALARRGIFCTEPFRIPFAGKVDLCCFDKTGTLTSDDMEFRGVGGLSDCEEAETDMSKVPVRTLEILASCHALVFVDNKLVGDPLEKAALKGIDWSYKADEKALPRRGNGNSVQIMQRYHFASHLKRMSVIVRIQEEYFVFVKGAPETIQDRLVDVPALYVETYKKYTRQGSRVLALAFKRLPDMMVSEARDMDRDAVECDLTFAGFAVFNCPIRSDSATVLLELKNSSHDLVMITGDQALTACHVASKVHIVSNPVLILGRSRTGDEYKWVSPDEKEIIPYSDKEIETLAEAHDLCIGGDSIEMLQATSSVLRVIPFVKVFARVAPQQKELILTTFKAVGRGTLMCGDGTNDVGALKQAHVGVALLNTIPPSSPSDSSKDDTKSKSKKSKLPLEPASKTVIQNGEGSSKGKTPHNRHLTAAEMQRQKLKKMMDELNSDEADGRSAPLVKLGDASMASPFTAKHASVAPVTDIIRQGRSTLVTTLQMFKILGLNCLATAYVLSVMYLDGVKLGDVQATISGVLTAAFFLFISHARPLQTLSSERPHPSVFSLYLFLSLLGQFAVHLTFLIYSVKEAEKHMPEECIEPDASFHPNLVNTVSYMVSMMLQVATFAVNYMGHPFNQSIRENKPFFYALIAGAGFFTVIASDLFRDLNDSLKLVPLPEGLRDKLLLWASLMFIICYSWERLLRWAFPGKISSWKHKQRAAAANLDKKKKV